MLGAMLTASDTAFSIAVVRAEEGARPMSERLFEDPYAHLFRAAGAHAEEGTKRYLDLPFFRDGIRLRTRFIDDVLSNALADGIVQIVLLGTGFDTRALRVPAIAERGAHVYELDLLDQLQLKRRVLAEGGVPIPDWVSYIASDLTTADYETTVAEALEDAGFRRDRGALVIWEGVTTYIGVAATDRSLQFLATLVSSEVRVVFDVGASFFGAETVNDHVTHAGFSSCEVHGGDDLWLRYLPGAPNPAAEVFRMVLARR